MSAMPIGIPGWPEFAFCTASMLSARIALASCRRVGIGDPRGESRIVHEAGGAGKCRDMPHFRRAGGRRRAETRHVPCILRAPSHARGLPDMSDSYLFTSESVSEGHPDKLADQISDAVLDAMLAQDKRARVACETLVKTGVAIVAGEV